jgi:DNA (cytosine-5)-methyltransferase 1
VTSLTAVSLFAGVGGIDLALERAGVHVAAAVEIDDAARGVLHDRFPQTKLFRDVTEVTSDDLRRAGFVPERGIIAAGWPCQGNSVAGRREGMADPRSGLWRHVVRLLAETRARWFLGENVPGLLSVNDGDDFATVVHDLGALGYGGACRVLDAQHFGVPQRRRRVFFVGCLGDQRRPVEVLAEPEGGGGDPAAGGQARPEAAGRLGYGLGVAGEPGGVANTLTARQQKGANPEKSQETLVVSTLQGGGRRGHRIDAEAAGGGTSSSCRTSRTSHPHTHTHTFQKVIRPGARDVNGDLPPEVWAERDVAATLNLNDLGSESRSVELVVSATGDVTHALTSEGADASEDGTGRGTPIITFGHVNGIDIQPSTTTTTIRAGHDAMPSIATETTVRRLTPRECERLQGFPDDWTLTSNGKPQADSARYRQMGNAVAVPCVEWIARRIVGVA